MTCVVIRRCDQAHAIGGCQVFLVWSGGIFRGTQVDLLLCEMNVQVTCNMMMGRVAQASLDTDVVPCTLYWTTPQMNARKLRKWTPAMLYKRAGSKGFRTGPYNMHDCCTPHR